MSKWYPDLAEILEDSIIVYDTSALLNVYRYSLVSSKRILNYFKKYEENIWLPNQVKKEFNNNKDKVKSPNLYKNLDKELIKLVGNKRDELLVELSEYEKRGFSKFSELQGEIEVKFGEMNDIIKQFKEGILEEIGVYKEFINEVDDYLGNLLKSEKVEGQLNTVDLLEVLKEGEIRYKYNIPPGYEDAKTKEGIDKFGDLIIWKQILKKAEENVKNNVVFVTSDTKQDWFHKDKQNEIEGPRRELISEFNHYNCEKQVIIIPFEDFMEEVSDPSDPSDRELLLELRMNNLVKRLPYESFLELAENKIQSIDINDVMKKLVHSSNDMERVYINRITQISAPMVENVNLHPNGIKVNDNEIIYYINAVVECEFETISSNYDLISYGHIYSEVTLNIEVKRKLEDSEKNFIDNFEKDYSDYTIITHYSPEMAKYIWGSDDVSLISNEVYTNCPSCSRGISKMNDAGDGFCIICSDSQS
ncbi:PIN-like domain-containing protein [Bacillus altitudinis]|uniref:PIN-like domain-containing protein n=1 Tax=Bacillus altitudinis TaxID=293387 RepID=UPI0011A91B08|nr:PIN-like domain-containing protein [Bacillus altitudinis]